MERRNEPLPEIQEAAVCWHEAAGHLVDVSLNPHSDEELSDALQDYIITVLAVETVQTGDPLRFSAESMNAIFVEGLSLPGENPLVQRLDVFSMTQPQWHEYISHHLAPSINPRHLRSRKTPVLNSWLDVYRAIHEGTWRYRHTTAS
jgi:hypothetical protein